MHVVLTNFGTTGDVQPLVSVGVELARAGHRATLAASPGFAELAESRGLGFRPVGPDLTDEINAVTLRSLEDPDLHARDGGAAALGEPLMRNLPAAFEDLSAVCREADLLVSGPQQPAARMIHERTGLPFVSVQLTYVDNPGNRAYREATQALVDPFRRSLGLPPLADPMTRGADSPQLALYAVSRHVLPPPRNWEGNRHMPGFFFLDDDEFTPPPELEEFLAAGEPPVVITFGSNFHRDPEAVTAALLRAVAAGGRRALLQQGWSGLGSLSNEAREILPPERLFSVGYVPHAWLFPRAAAVVCHGGVGTSAAVFRSGVPGVFVPHVFDQFLWARLAADLGVAPEPVELADLADLADPTTPGLIRALERAVADETLRRRAAGLGRSIHGEPGVAGARRHIEDLMRSLGVLDVPRSAAPSPKRRWGRSARHPRPDRAAHGAEA